MQYSSEPIIQLNNSFDEIEEEYRMRFYGSYLKVTFKEQRAKEFFRHRFSRRF